MSLHYTKIYTLSLKNTNLKVDRLTGGKWFTHGPKHRKTPLAQTLQYQMILISTF